MTGTDVYFNLLFARGDMETLFDIFHIETGWQAFFTAVDLAIVYYVIYRVLLLIKGTRALQMLFGLVFVLVLFFMSQEDYLHLTTTHWVIDIFMANLIIIVVIIFQEDIRRALAQFGSTTLMGGRRSYEETSVLEEVIKACVMLSDRKLGALIAIEREADLDHYVQQGIEVDGVASKDMLFTIFLPEHQNPLHDGAVIIRKGRIAAAGAFLPLTINPRVEKSLGTRHRAAIGLTEDTDAAVAIVSEETGRISVAHDGELFKDLDANEMRAFLQRIYSSRHLHRRRGTLLDRFRAELSTSSGSGPSETDSDNKSGDPDDDATNSKSDVEKN